MPDNDKTTAINMELLNSIANALPGLAYRRKADLKGQFLYLSEGCQAITGYHHDELMEIKRGLGPLIHAEDQERVAQDIGHALSKQDNYELQYRVMAKSGEVRWVWDKGCGVYSPNGQLQALQGYLCDVTDKVVTEQRFMTQQIKLGALMEQKLQDARRHNGTLSQELLAYQDQEASKSALINRLKKFQNAILKIATSSCVVNGNLRQTAQLVTTLATKELDVQRATVWMYSGDHSALIQHDCYDPAEGKHKTGYVVNQNEFPLYFDALENARVITADDVAAEPVVSEFKDYLLSLGIQATVSAVIRVSGEQRGLLTLDWIGSTRHWETDEIAFVGELADQVSFALLNHSNKEAERVAAQARVESRAKSEFLAIMSHEMRTPMNGVLGIAELLRSTDLTSQQLHFTNTIYESGHLLLDIINDVLDYSKINEGRLELEEVEYDLLSLIEQCTEVFASPGLENHLALVVDIEPGTPTKLRGDLNRLRQVLINLLSNAFKFTERGEIQLRVYRDYEYDDNSMDLIFEITDSGIGISDEEQKALFEPFTQARFSTARKHGGTGLGLAICKKLVTLMGGQISVASQPGIGSCFTFSVKCGRAVEGLISDDCLPTQSLSDKRLLVVDSHPLFAKVSVKMAASWGILVCQVGSIAGAQKIIQETVQPFDIALVASSLSDGNGLDFAQTLCREGSAKHIILSVEQLDLQGKRLLSQQSPDLIDLVIEKPLTERAMFRACASVLDMKTSSDQNLNNADGENGFSHVKVLVAEDNAVNQIVVKGLLAKLGIQPFIVENGKQALVQVKNQGQFDLILMDCEMPEMDGYEATVRIRKYEKDLGKAPVPIVALTAHAVSEFRQRAYESGMDEYITKPLNKGVLLSLLKTYFSLESA